MHLNRSIGWLTAALAVGSCSLNTTDGADSGGPQVTILNPAPNATVSGQVAVDADAVDDTRVDRVRFIIDSDQKLELFTPPFHFVWNTTGLQDNSVHTIRVQAIDPFGNIGSSQISVTVVNGPQ
jgi:hypothetical protein